MVKWHGVKLQTIALILLQLIRGNPEEKKTCKTFPIHLASVGLNHVRNGTGRASEPKHEGKTNSCQLQVAYFHACIAYQQQAV